MAEIAGKFVPAEFRPGELLCKVDEVSDHLIILYEGKVSVLRQKTKMNTETWLRHKLAHRISKNFLIK